MKSISMPPFIHFKNNFSLNGMAVTCGNGRWLEEKFSSNASNVSAFD